MKAFRYTVLDPKGRKLNGIGYANNAQILRDQFLDAQMHPSRIRPVFFQRTARLAFSEAEAARFARDLSQLLSSGLSVTQGLGLIQGRETPRVAAIAREVRHRLSAGAPLSVALKAAEGRPSAFLQALARAGEASGQQAHVFTAGASSLAASDALKKRLVTLCLYPVFVIGVAVLSIAVYAYAVLPSLEPAFEHLGSDLPLQTRSVLAFGSIVRAALPVLAGLAATFTLGLAVSQRLRRLTRDIGGRFLLRGKRSPLKDYIFAGIASRLSAMTHAGVPLATAWKLSREPIDFPSIVRLLEVQDERLMEGARLSSVLAAVPITPRDLIHYVSLGEQTGRVAQSLNDAAAVLSGRSQEAIERVLSILTPLVIVIVGGMVGLITMMVFQGLLAVGDAVAT